MIRPLVLIACLICFTAHATNVARAQELHLTQQDVLETRGLSVLLFHNSYHKVFGDQKMSGLEIILQDQRIATNGDVRLSPTPAQWDPIPDFETRKRGQLQMKLQLFVSIRIRACLIALMYVPRREGFDWLFNSTVHRRMRSSGKRG